MTPLNLAAITRLSRRGFLVRGVSLGCGIVSSADLMFLQISSARATTTLNFQLSWIKSGQYAGFFAGVENHYYRDVGIDVTFNAGGPNIDTIANVAAGRDELGDRPVGSIIVARERGIPIKAIAAVYQRNPYCIISLPEKPIRTVRDMAGKTIGASASARPLLLNMLKENGVDPQMVNVVPATVDPSSLVNKQIDGYMGFETHEAVMLKLQGIQIVVLNLHDLGFPETAVTIYGRDDFLAAHKDTVVLFLRAAIKSWQWTLDHPDLATKLLVEKYGVSGLDPRAVLAEIQTSTKFIYTGIAQREGLLALDMPLYGKILDTYRKAGLIKSGMKASDLCDPQYITAAHART